MLAQKIVLNTAWQIAGKTLGVVTGVAVIALLTRALGKDGFGGFATITSYLQFFGIIVDFGLTLIAAQMLSVPSLDPKKTFNNIFTLKVVSSAVIFGLAVVVSWFTNYPMVVKVGITVASVSFAINAIQQVFVGWYQKYLRIARLAFAEIIGKVTLLIGITLVILLDGGLLWVMPVLIAASLSYLVFTVYFIKDAYTPSFAFDWEVWQEIIKRSYPIALGIIFNLIYLKADTVILSLTRSQAEVGIYGASFRVLEFLITLPLMLFGLMLPVLTERWEKKDLAGWKTVYQKTLDLLQVALWPLVLGGIVVAKPAMALIAGEEFALSAPLLQILLLALAAISFSSLFGHLIISVNLQKKSIWMYGVTALITLMLYLMFIPRFSFWAAAVLTLGSEVAIMALTYLLVGTTTKFWPSFRIGFASLAAALGMAVILYLLSLNLALTILLGVVVYPILLILFMQKTPRMLIKHLQF